MIHLLKKFLSAFGRSFKRVCYACTSSSRWLGGRFRKEARGGQRAVRWSAGLSVVSFMGLGWVFYPLILSVSFRLLPIIEVAIC